MVVSKTGKFMQIDKQELRDRKTGETSVLYLLSAFVDGNAVQVYVSPKHEDLPALQSMGFGDDICLDLNFEHQQGTIYKVKFGGLAKEPPF